MPGAKLFAFYSEPSPEVLAGNGPTMTYPKSPSSGATPEAIASVAGGIPVSPGEAVSNPTVQVSGIERPGNQGAAQANGFNVDTQTAGFVAPPGSVTPPVNQPTKPSGYSFGQRTFTPKTPAPAEQSQFEIPPMGTPQTSTPTPPVIANNVPVGTSGNGGFTLPSTLSPTVGTSPEVPASPNNFGVPSMSGLGETGAPEAAKAPSFTTASAVLPGESAVLPSDVSGPSDTSTYSPGSTGGDLSYPTGGFSPNTQGSFFR